MSVHVLCSGVYNYVRAEVERLAEDWRRESVVDNQRDAVFVGDLCEALNVKDGQGWIRDCLAEDELRVRLEGAADFFIAGILVNEDAFDAKLLEGECE